VKAEGTPKVSKQSIRTSWADNRPLPIGSPGGFPEAVKEEETLDDEKPGDRIRLWVVISDNGLAVRSSPHRFGKIIGHLSRGQVFLGLSRGGKDNSWVQNVKGWCCYKAFHKHHLLMLERQRLANELELEPYYSSAFNPRSRRGYCASSFLPKRTEAMKEDQVKLSRANRRLIAEILGTAMHGESIPMLVEAISIARAWDYDGDKMLMKASKALDRLKKNAMHHLKHIDAGIEHHRTNPDVYLQKRLITLTPRMIAEQICFIYDTQGDGTRLRLEDFLLFAEDAQLRLRRQPKYRQEREYVELCRALRVKPQEGISASKLMKAAPLEVLRDTLQLHIKLARGMRKSTAPPKNKSDLEDINNSIPTGHRYPSVAESRGHSRNNSRRMQSGKQKHRKHHHKSMSIDWRNSSRESLVAASMKNIMSSLNLSSEEKSNPTIRLGVRAAVTKGGEAEAVRPFLVVRCFEEVLYQSEAISDDNEPEWDPFEISIPGGFALDDSLKFMVFNRPTNAEAEHCIGKVFVLVSQLDAMRRNEAKLAQKHLLSPNGPAGGEPLSRTNKLSHGHISFFLVEASTGSIRT